MAARWNMSALSDRQKDELCVPTADRLLTRSNALTLCPFTRISHGPVVESSHFDSWCLLWRRISCGRRHKSILDYFHAQGMTDSFAALLNESKVDFVPEPKTKYSGLLEKKWTSVIRLQKKVRGCHQCIVPDHFGITSPLTWHSHTSNMMSLDYGSREP